MLTRRRCLFAVAVLVPALLLAVYGTVSAQTAKPKDIAKSWAQDHITALISKGVAGVYSDGTFRPNAAMTRGQFARYLAKAFPGSPQGTLNSSGSGSGATPDFTDTKNHWARPYVNALSSDGVLSGYPDGSFRPDQSITRVDAIAALTKISGLAEKPKADTGNLAKLTSGVSGSGLWAAQLAPRFQDIPAGHWAYQNLETAYRLGILPRHWGGNLEPGKALTRAEAAALIHGAMSLDISKGVALGLNRQSRTLSVKKLDGAGQTFSFAGEPMVIRNGVLSQLDNVLQGDQVIVAAAQREPRYVRAYGIVTKQDVLAKLSDATGGTLSPSQVEALASGNWRQAASSLGTVLYNQLLQDGATPWEAEAILQKDWSTLGNLAKQRLVQAVSERYQLSPGVAEAVLDKDWSRVKQVVQAEAMQQLLGRLLM